MKTLPGIGCITCRRQEFPYIDGWILTFSNGRRTVDKCACRNRREVARKILAHDKMLSAATAKVAGLERALREAEATVEERSNEPHCLFSKLDGELLNLLQAETEVERLRHEKAWLVKRQRVQGV